MLNVGAAKPAQRLQTHDQNFDVVRLGIKVCPTWMLAGLNKCIDLGGRRQQQAVVRIIGTGRDFDRALQRFAAVKRLSMQIVATVSKIRGNSVVTQLHN